jgi:thiopeptide-type bacteriocin biosynthesis protein
MMNIREIGFFVLRTPLLPFDEALKWSESLACADLLRQRADADAIKRAWYDDIALLRARLLHLMQKPATQQALAIASPSLYRATAAWIDRPDSKKGLQAERALSRYFMRMTGRSTPFGLFSGCSVGTTKVNAPTQILLAPQTKYRTATRLDFEYITSLATALRNDRDARAQMPYSANSSLYRIAHGWHYIECRFSGATRSYHLAKLESDVYLDSVIASTKGHERTLDELAAVLVSLDRAGELTINEITEYLNALIDSDVIVPSILPRLTGDGALRGLLDDLRDIPSARDICTILGEVDDQFRDFDARPFTVGANEYFNVAEQLEQLPGIVDPEHIVQVDMFKPVEIANLGGPVISEVNNALRVLGSFAVARESPAMIQFRNAFVERYEKRWVPLTEALDLEMGVGYGDLHSSDDSPLLSRMALGGDGPTEDIDHLNPLHSFLLQKILDSTATGSNEVEIRDCDLPHNSAFEELLPESFSVLVSLISSSSEALSKGDFELVFKGGQGPSSARALARFCSSDLELMDLVRNAVREEEASDPEAIFAEIVHQPEGRIGNVICRPLLREIEIPFMGRSGAPVERQLPIDDLLLGIADGRVTLYSRSLQRQIHPRLSSAHNYIMAGLSPVYRFLCDLQNQGGIDVPSFKWGRLSKLKRLPRVRVGRVILARGQWRLSATDIEALGVLDRYQGFLKFKELQYERGLPRWVLMSEHENLLPLDLDNPLSVDSLLHLLKRSGEATLVEMHPQDGNQSVTGPEGAFEHELLIPLSKVRSSTATPRKRSENGKAISTAARIPRTDRLVAPGGSWHYVKIYSGYSVLDELLIKDIGPLISNLYADGCATSWFFVRYADPEPHLRLRFQPTGSKALEYITDATRSLLANGRTWKIQWDTYHREIERYGGIEGILASEELFCADSEATLTVLQALDPDDPDMRWRSAMLGMDKLLSDCNISIHDRVHFTDRMRGSLGTELRVKTRDKQEVGTRFRHERAILESLLDKDASSTNPRYSTILEAYRRRSDRIKFAVDRLRGSDEAGRPITPFIEIIASHLHMNLNRIMKSAARTHEFVLYEFLYRVYEGRCAREKIERPL